MSSDLILIADGNLGRGRRVATALEAAGRRCEVTPDGAGALEIALVEYPRILVTQADLALVDCGKLVEILRANPRTRAARFLFLGVEPGREAPLGGVGDESLPPNAETNDIKDAVEVLIERQARIEALEERASSEREFEGSLEELRPAEILQRLNVRRSTGRLTFTPILRDGSTPDGWIQVVEGEIHSAAAGPVASEKALFRMLDWVSGEFHFGPREICSKPAITSATRSVLAEGLRQLDEWKRLAPKFPPLESPVKLAVDRGELPTTMNPLTHEILGLLGSANRVSDVVDHCKQSDYQVLRTLHTLAERGIVEFGRVRLAPPEKTAHALFHQAQVRRLRSFAAQGTARDQVPASSKLLLVAANEATTEQFASLLMKVPDVELTPRFERGQIGSGDLESMARIDVDEDLSIDLVHLPNTESFAALWAFAGHQALGTIFLLDGRLGASAAGFAEISKELSIRSNQRTFHVVILGEGERISPDELRENMSLIDDASLFLLPMESEKDPGSLLRSLFARIVP